MAKIGKDLTNTEEETNSFKPLPAGNYDVVVDGAEIKPTRSKTGFYINFKLKVINSEKHSKRVIFDIVNLKNDSAECEKIGDERLKRMLSIHGMPVDGSADTDDFIGKAFQVYIKIDKSEEYGDGNKITSYEKTSAEFKEEKTAGNIPDSWV